jgi:hypothetical protein
MRIRTGLCLCAIAALGITGTAVAAPVQKDGYLLRDTTSLPPPAAGMARLVIARDMRVLEVLREEYVFCDRTPLGLLAQRSAIAVEVPPGWHRVWLGRGRSAAVWMEFVADGRYLLRLREQMVAGAWRGDLVREAAAGYAEFALGRGMQLSVMDARGTEKLQKDLGRPPANAAQKDSTARAEATAKAALPIVIKEAWYLPIPSDAPASSWQSHTGTITLDDKSLRFVRADTLVIEIPRASVTDVNFGAQKGGAENPWIKVTYRENGEERGATFADAVTFASTETYNRLFAELARGLPGH